VLCAGQPWPALRAALDDRRLAMLLPLAVAVALLCLAHLPFAFAYLYLPLVAAALMLDVAAVALVTLAVSATMALALATGVFVPPPIVAEWQQAFLYLAFAEVLVPALLLAAAMAEMRDHQTHLLLRKQELKRANEGLQQFVHLASHDLREPLNTVAQFSALVALDHAERLPPDAREWLALVCREAQHMRDLLDDVLQYAEVQQIRLPAPAAVPLDEVALDARRTLARDIDDTGARLQIGALPVVRGHRPLLRLMMEHLLSNALKFVPGGRAPAVVIQAEQREGWAIVTISDNGIGIAEADLPRLFRPFQRLHLRREFEGTGLGLATCLQVVRAHGGDIRVRSVPDQGTRMQVWLPLAQPAGGGSVA
jgi:signal transduction histidine kinase